MDRLLTLALSWCLAFGVGYFGIKFGEDHHIIEKELPYLETRLSKQSEDRARRHSRLKQAAGESLMREHELKHKAIEDLGTH